MDLNQIEAEFQECINIFQFKYDFKTLVFKTIEKIKDIEYELAEFEILDNVSVLFTLWFNNDRIVYLKHQVHDNEAYFSLYKDQDCLENGTGMLDDIIDVINEKII